MRKRTLVVTGITAWALLLLGLAFAAYRSGPDTVPGQTTVAQARSTMDRVTGELAAISPSVTIGEYAEHPCDITKVREGRSLQRDLTFTTSPGAEGTLLRSIATSLPARYHAKTSERDDTITLYADAGTFVSIRGHKGDEGTVIITLASGCRTLS
jgi:hypothetical protein